MKIINYLYTRYLFSFFLSVSISFSLFYIFSLFGHLNEDLNFKSVLYLSYLNSVQILTYIPSFIAFLSILLFVFFLKSRNEILIIKEYLSTKVVLIFFLPIVILFTLFLLNKEKIIDLISNSKEDFLDFNHTYDTKVIIDEQNNKKIFTIIKGLDFNDSHIGEMQKYYVADDQIIQGEFSDNLQIIDNKIIAKELTQFKMNNIVKIDKPFIILDNLNNFIKSQPIHYHRVNDNKLKNIVNLSGRLFYIILLFYSLIIILFNKKIIDKKNSMGKPVILCLSLLIYSLIINSLELNFLSEELGILSLSMIFLIFIKYFQYE